MRKSSSRSSLIVVDVVDVVGGDEVCDATETLHGKTVKLMNVATATMTKREVLRIIGDGTNRYGIFDANNVPMSRDIPPFA